MTLSELIKLLRDAQHEYGDADIQVVANNTVVNFPFESWMISSTDHLTQCNGEYDWDKPAIIIAVE